MIEKTVREALLAYGLSDASYEFIRHNENITCKVSDGGNHYSLRIHRPVDGFSTSLITDGRNEISLFQSEAALLEYMKGNGFDELQQPVRNLQGDHVTVLQGAIPAMLLTWVDGEPVKPEDAGKYAFALGELACKIHRAAKGFAADRIRYDNALCDRMIDEIHFAADAEHISLDEGEICIRELNAVKDVQNKYRNENILLHADLGFGNIIVTETGLVPIDFSLSGYGCEAQEAGMLMSNYQDDESRRKILEGFAKCGTVIDPTEAEIFLSYSVLLFICAQHGKAYKEEWFANAMKRWCRELFTHV